MKIGAIDVGTNSIHLLIAEVAPDGTMTVVEKDRAQVELGAGGLGRNRITDRAFQAGLDAIGAFREACDSHRVEDIHAAGTSAVREAENGAAFCKAVKEQYGVHVRMISGPDEGRLIWLGARQDLDLTRGRALLVDLGGGSCEFVLCARDRVLASHSVPLGHIRLAERFHKQDPMPRKAWDALKAAVKSTLKPLSKEIRRRDFITVVGTSGTMRCLARMATAARGDEAPAHSQGLVLKRHEIDALCKQLKSATLAEIVEIPGMDPRRRRTITAGALVVRQVMRTWDQEELITNDRSLRDGLVADWIIRNRPQVRLSGSFPDPRRRSIIRLLQRYRVDRAHGEQVCRFALALFDATAGVHQLGPQQRELLEFGALVHDLGHHIAGDSHHRHGQYLIRHTRLHGFTAPEIAILGNLVRYHRGGKPKTEHLEYAALSRSDRRAVRVLAGILRVADALDRSHEQPVGRIDVVLEPGRLRVRALARQEAHLERWAVKRRQDLLESALGRTVQVTIEPPPSPDPPTLSREPSIG